MSRTGVRCGVALLMLMNLRGVSVMLFSLLGHTLATSFASNIEPERKDMRADTRQRLLMTAVIPFAEARLLTGQSAHSSNVTIVSGG